MAKSAHRTISASIVRSTTFTVSRWIGATEFTNRVAPSKFLRSYMVFAVLGVTLISIYQRITHLSARIGGTAKSETSALDIIKYLMGFLMHFSTIATCIAHLVQSLRKHQSFKSIFKSTQRRRNSASEKTLVAVVLLIHAASARNDLAKKYNYFFSGKFTVSLMSFYTTMVSLQFQCLLKEKSQELSTLGQHLLKQRIYYGRFCNVIETCRTIDAAYQWQTLFILVQAFGYGVTYSYYIVHDCLREVHGHEQTIATFDLDFYLWTIVMNAIKIWSVASEPQNLQNKAEAFNNELFKLMRSNRELCRDSKLFLYVTMRQTVKFTACGFFTLGYPLVTSIIAAATTYLVILLQFSMPATKQ